MTLIVKSNDFIEGGLIPSVYTCDGKNMSPPIQWSPGPQGVMSYVLIADDPDAPVGTWVHWVLFNIPREITELPEHIPSDETLSNKAIHGSNDFQRLGYGGPCPPSGTHRYYFKIYALDITLNLLPGSSKSDVERAMSGHVIAQGQLMGRYKRR